MSSGISGLGRGSAVAGLSLVLLGGCATSGPPDGAATAGLFHADGRPAGRLSPGPSGRWYVARSPHFLQTGLAGWSLARPARRGFFARLFHRKRPAEASAVIASRSSLPLPSVVDVSNLANGAHVQVRVEARANLPPGQLIRLDPATAAALAADPAHPIQVRVRYLAPVVAYRDRGRLTYAWLGRKRPSPAAPSPATAPIELAKASPSPVPATPVRVAAMTRPPEPFAPVVHAPSPPPRRYAAIQAGAFAQEGNARRAAARLASAGEARIEPTLRNGGMLYIVVVRDSADARTLRARVSEAGFPDARVRSF